MKKRKNKLYIYLFCIFVFVSTPFFLVNNASFYNNININLKIYMLQKCHYAYTFKPYIGASAPDDIPDSYDFNICHHWFLGVGVFCAQGNGNEAYFSGWAIQPRWNQTFRYGDGFAMIYIGPLEFRNRPK